MKALSLILLEMLERDMVDSFMTVESPAGAGHGPYYSISEIPHEIDDHYSGRKLRVRPENIILHYRRHGDQRR